MKKFIFSILVFGFLFVLSVSNVFACSCLLIEDKSLEEQVRDEYTKATGVISGEVLEVTKEPDTFWVKVKFKVENTWKKKFSREVTIKTASDGATCGYAFEVGKKYLVYVYDRQNTLETNICTRTSLLKSNKDITVLNKIKKRKVKFAPK